MRPDPSERSGPLPATRPVDALLAAVEAVVGTDLDAYDDAQLRADLAAAHQAIERLTAFRATVTGTLESRALRAAGPGRERTALRAVHDQLAGELRLPTTEVRRAGETGRRTAERPSSAAALAEGRLRAAHARILADTLRLIDDPAGRDAAEAELLPAAAEQDARTFGRTCRRVLIEVDADAAQRRLDRQHAQRGLSVSTADNGMLELHGRGAGLDAEVVQTALHAFRTPDAPGEHRTPEQRSWDALVKMSHAILDAGVAPTNRKVRPHILVKVAEPVVADRDGTANGPADAAWSGPLPWSETRRLLADAGVSRILTDAAGLPLEAGEAVRSVPAGLWKALQIRDAVCVGDGCDIPAVWCDVMHLEIPYRFRGRLTLETAALGCRYHHGRFDHHGWTITWRGRRPVLHHPDRPPAVDSGGTTAAA